MSSTESDSDSSAASDGSATATAAAAAHEDEENYSTQQSICSLHPPGLPHSFDVPFPERRLPVCDRCKKNFKSRDHCRKRDGHKSLPWQTTYVVVTITDSLLIKGAYYKETPMVAELQETPMMCLGPSDGSMKVEPICKVCRERNYTRDYCRNTCKHTTPPWSTTYVKLVADKTIKGRNRLNSSKKRKRNQKEHSDANPEVDLPNSQDKEDEGKSDDLTLIHKSKTFLAAISSKRTTFRWCERIQYPAVSGHNKLGESIIQHVPADSANMSATNNTNKQLKNSQLWDAFRAGVTWARSQGAGQVPLSYAVGTSFAQTPSGGTNVGGNVGETTARNPSGHNEAGR